MMEEQASCEVMEVLALPRNAAMELAARVER
jgi:hypothetical protein